MTLNNMTLNNMTSNTMADNKTTLLVQLNHIGLYYDQRAVLKDVDLSIEAKEIVSLIGPNGAGKSSLVKISFPASISLLTIALSALPSHIHAIILSFANS